VIIPAFALKGQSPFIGRYSGAGDGAGGALAGVLADPLGAAGAMVTSTRLAYLVTLLAPLLFLPLLAPLLAMAALPQLAINLLAGAGIDDGTGGVNPIHTIQYHYAVVLVPFLVAAAMLGLANLRDGRVRLLRRPRLRAAGARLRAAASRPAAVATVLVAAVVLAGVRGGPLPIWGWLPGGWQGSSLHVFTQDDSTRALAEAVALVPDDAAVSATNDAGSHLSARRRITLFPVIAGAEWAVVSDTPRTRAVARDRPTLRPERDRPTLRPVTFRPVLAWMRNSPRWELVYERAGVSVFRRVAPPPGAPVS